MPGQTPYQKQWVKDNPDKIKEYQKRYLEKHGDRVRAERTKKYYENKEHHQELHNIMLKIKNVLKNRNEPIISQIEKH